jgi:hypothetical protein
VRRAFAEMMARELEATAEKVRQEEAIARDAGDHDRASWKAARAQAFQQAAGYLLRRLDATERRERFFDLLGVEMPAEAAEGST